jgi:hypothetical protein
MSSCRRQCPTPQLIANGFTVSDRHQSDPSDPSDSGASSALPDNNFIQQHLTSFTLLVGLPELARGHVQAG